VSAPKTDRIILCGQPRRVRFGFGSTLEIPVRQTYRSPAVVSRCTLGNSTEARCSILLALISKDIWHPLNHALGNVIDMAAAIEFLERGILLIDPARYDGKRLVVDDRDAFTNTCSFSAKSSEVSSKR